MAATAPAGGAAEAPLPGSAAWHRLNLAMGAAQLATAAVMIALLYVTRAPRPAQGRGQAARGCALALGVLLALLPITAAQQQLGEVVWRWWHPEAAPPVHEVLRALQESEWGAWGTVQLVVSAVVVAPLVEELFFRGVVLNALCLHLRRAWASVLVAAIAFGCVHAQPQDILPLISMGIVLGYLRLRTGSLALCIAVHALFNARTMVFAMLAPELVKGG
jgi:membrane protease YdiL (CAAX protease family)